VELDAQYWRVVTMSDVPQGFEPIFRVSPISELLGPVYYKGKGYELSLGLRAQAKHANLRGSVHGGVLAAIADMALGYTLAFAQDPPMGLVTANLSIDYAGSAKIGDWMETRTDVQRQGGRLAFANCYIYVGDQRIVRASGVFLASEWPAGSTTT
jgi:acyl-coenzyme A thioesterase 13